jgi:hypothetical protein
MEIRNLVGQTVANALGTLIALGVAYIVGVVAGVFAAETFALAVSALGLVVGLLAGYWSARDAGLMAEMRRAKEIVREAERRSDDD